MVKQNLNQLLNRIEENIDGSKINSQELENTHRYSMPLGDYKVEVTPIPTMSGLFYVLSVKSSANEEVLEIDGLSNNHPEDYKNRVENIFWKMKKAKTGKEPKCITEAKKIEEQRQTKIKEFDEKYEQVIKEVLGSLD